MLVSMGDHPGGSDELARELSGTWFRSFEEESGSDLVFRPPAFDFPRSRRPRPALRLHPDGTAVALRGGPSDRPEPVPTGGTGRGSGLEAETSEREASGRWAVQDSTLTLDTPDLAGTFWVEAADSTRLVIRPAAG